MVSYVYPAPLFIVYIHALTTVESLGTTSRHIGESC